jgi:hypothetical protein
MNNDKIDALWAQSIKTVEVPLPDEIYKLGEGIFRRYETYDHIKFAELIVRECANRASWAQDTSEKDIGGEVLNHFGVEE